jgi:catechol 2,3-dioxygenase-like lactoylglutathione lyase family enzyme
MGLAGINHLALVTNDMDRTVRFYRDVLGMEVVGTLGAELEPGVPMRHYFFSLGQSNTLAFFEWQGIEMPPPKDSGVRASGRQFDHVSFNVDSEEALLEMQARIRSHGVPATNVVDHGFIHSIYLEDPNGISLEFSVWTKDLTKEPLFKDPNPVAALLEGAQAGSVAPA